MSEIVTIFITAGTKEEGERIAKSLVEERLAACANVVSPMRSIYRWKGEICDEEEALLIIKSTKARLQDLIRRVQNLHSYETPEIIALPVIQGSEEYLKWVQEETEGNS